MYSIPTTWFQSAIRNLDYSLQAVWLWRRSTKKLRQNLWCAARRSYSEFDKSRFFVQIFPKIILNIPGTQPHPWRNPNNNPDFTNNNAKDDKGTTTNTNKFNLAAFSLLDMDQDSWGLPEGLPIGIQLKMFESMA